MATFYCMQLAAYTVHSFTYTAQSSYPQRSRLLADNLAVASRYLPCTFIHSDSDCNRCAHVEVLPRFEPQLPTLK
jgi:hypothetical protein